MLTFFAWIVLVLAPFWWLRQNLAEPALEGAADAPATEVPAQPTDTPHACSAIEVAPDNAPELLPEPTLDTVRGGPEPAPQPSPSQAEAPGPVHEPASDTPAPTPKCTPQANTEPIPEPSSEPAPEPATEPAYGSTSVDPAVAISADASVDTSTPNSDAAAASPAKTCLACGKRAGKLLRCGRCRSVWFCNRDCQILAARQGHSGANCRTADSAFPSPSKPLKETLSPFASPSRPPAPSPLDPQALTRKFQQLLNEGEVANAAHSRVGYLSSAQKLREANETAVAIGGTMGAWLRTQSERILAHSLLRAGERGPAARAACSSARAARAASSRTLLVEAIVACGIVAREVNL